MSDLLDPEGEPAPDAKLIEVAAQIAEGGAIDWDAIEREHPGEAEVVQGLKRMERVLRAQRDARSTQPPVNPIGVWGHLQLVEILARGSFGEVYRAYDPQLQIDVALKLFHPAGSPGTHTPLEDCLKEARQMARIRHLHVVRIFGADVRGGRAGIWMELIRGKTLETFLKENGTLSIDEAARVGIQVCSALAEVHAIGMVHRDVKTSNVMREEGGRIVLMDFGAASMSDPLAAGGGIYGTPQTAAPELFCGAEGTPATDVYSVGVLLFRLVTGHFPVEASTHEDLIAKHARGERTSLRTLRPSAPPWFASIVDRALDPDPNARFESAARMEESLANGLHRKARISTRALVLLGLLLLGVTAFDTPRIPIPTRLAVDASLMRDRIHDVSPLKSGDRIEPGEGVFLVLRCEEPVWTYVINRDQAGSVYVLHPLPGFDKPNPLMPGVEHRLPGHHEGVTESWWVSSAGGDEEFIVIVSRGHRPELEAAVQALPHAGPRGGELDVPLTRGTGETAPSANPDPPVPTILPAVLEAILSGPDQPDVRVVRFTLKNPLP